MSWFGLYLPDIYMVTSTVVALTLRGRTQHRHCSREITAQVTNQRKHNKATMMLLIHLELNIEQNLIYSFDADINNILCKISDDVQFHHLFQHVCVMTTWLFHVTTARCTKTQHGKINKHKNMQRPGLLTNVNIACDAAEDPGE